MTNDRSGVYLKYALFCRDTAEGDGDDLSCTGIIDLVDIEMPAEPPTGDAPRVLADVDVQLVFCIAGASPGEHTLESASGPLAPASPARRHSKRSGRTGFSSSAGSSRSASR